MGYYSGVSTTTMEIGRLMRPESTARGILCVQRNDGSQRYIRDAEAKKFDLVAKTRKGARIVVETDSSDPVYCRVLNDGREYQ